MSAAFARRTGDHPNIVLIVMDAARARNLSCYGYHRPTTPHLERLADRCVVYEQAISTAGWTLPAHASIFTGLYPSRHGAHDQHKYLSPEHPTMAELLRDRGYRTLAFCLNEYAGPATGLDRGFEWFNGDFAPGPRSLKRLAGRIDRGLAKVTGRTDAGARLINRHIRGALHRLRAGDDPFFIFVNYLEPHAPYRPPRNFVRYLPEGVSFQQTRSVNQDPWRYLIYPDSMRAGDFDILLALHDSAITYLDTRIGEVVSWLSEANLLDRTMIVVTADHGENVGDHELMGHGYCLYDTLVHIPLVIHYPTGVTTPGRVDHQVQVLDLLPTMLSMLGDTASETYRSLQGLDLLSSARHPFTIAEQANPDMKPFRKRFTNVDASKFDRALEMLRTDRYKYIWSSDNRHELYDLLNDPAEKNNLANERPDIARDLDRRLKEWQGTFEAAAPAEEAPEFDPQVVERLRALGYLE